MPSFFCDEVYLWSMTVPIRIPAMTRRARRRRIFLRRDFLWLALEMAFFSCSVSQIPFLSFRVLNSSRMMSKISGGVLSLVSTMRL